MTTATASASLSIERQEKTTSQVGMILALVSFTMMFAALFYSYGMLRIRSISWPPPGVPQAPIIVPSIITVLIGISSVALEKGRNALALNDVQRFRRYAIAAIVLGSLFIGLQAGVWVQMWDAGLTLVVGPYASLFYFLTLFHALHVLAGLGLLLWMYVAVPRSESGERVQDTARDPLRFSDLLSGVYRTPATQHKGA